MLQVSWLQQSMVPPDQFQLQYKTMVTAGMCCTSHLRRKVLDRILYPDLYNSASLLSPALKWTTYLRTPLFFFLFSKQTVWSTCSCYLLTLQTFFYRLMFSSHDLFTWYISFCILPFCFTQYNYPDLIQFAKDIAGCIRNKSKTVIRETKGVDLFLR